MTVICSRCAALLEEGSAFCGKCGAPRSEAAPEAPRLRFCINCGGALQGDSAFCPQCGAAVGAPVEVPPASQVAPPAPVAPVPAAPVVQAPIPPPSSPVFTVPPGVVPPKKGSSVLKIVLIVLGIIILLIMLAIGSCVYVGYRAVKKAEHGLKGAAAKLGQIQQQTRTTKPVGIESPSACPDVDPAQSEAFRKAAAAATLPLKPGLTLIDLWMTQEGSNNRRDIETIDSVQSIDAKSVTILQGRTAPPATTQPRVVCIADLLNSHLFQTEWAKDLPAIIPGATKISMSQVVFQDWKSGRASDFTLQESRTAGPGRYRVTLTQAGKLTPAPGGDFQYPVIVNGEPRTLPTIHVTGQLGDHDYEFWVLDDAANPLILKLTNSQGYHITYLKINYPVEQKIENDLKEKGRAEIYGIYFDFDSDKLRAESAPVLKEISDALHDHPAWKIRIEGHTDNQGGDDYNMRLSQRRAESVKGALINQYGVAADRMTPQGFGATHPKATNETIEGRALNRRVELVRE
jgi:outer membrane protein OmpA-like peptidoglycan-associated protein/RNA polymerase subunit RPABC4/transcription elongation factor Spt4